MYSQEVLRNTIVNYVSKVDKNWFLQKENKFKAHANYDKEQDLIIIRVPDFSQNILEIDQDGEPTSTEVVDCSYDLKINLRQYCALYLPIDETNHWGNFPEDDPQITVSPSHNIDEYSRDLVKQISSYLTAGVNNVETHKFIAVVLDKIEKELTPLKSSNSDRVYISVLDDFFKRCVSAIYRKYGRELTLYELIKDHVDTLEFSLTQNQMLALLFILNRAKFFTYTDNTPLLIFALAHFLYKEDSGTMVRPTSLKNLQKKYSDIAVSQSPKSQQDISQKGLDEVEERLKRIIQKLR